MTVRYLRLDDFVEIAQLVTGLDEATVRRSSRLELADSALNAPQASFGETDFHPEFVEKAAVLIVRLARNHPLPDGNKRAAWVSLRLFIRLNDWEWSPKPSFDESEQAVLAIAASEWDVAEAADWLGKHIRQSS
ncbi:MAG: type II toxin-antitoxin system death-on-curing family toxin [Solirubrobacterales bacterium]|nr:type II toxin-antitoxin system death-on-curing family toxin [Solirubrobacterales bacterium]